ncbi:hypothetical protein ABLI39_02210 [Pseudarthrobacter sp. B907]|uniref:hypothetical protein n=1 Tax=Pseudarthrobacter sp. B907 TaxID=3158261 RepID=UPI0032DA5257
MALAILLVLRVRRRVWARLRGLEWRRMALVFGAAAGLFYLTGAGGRMSAMSVAHGAEFRNVSFGRRPLAGCGAPLVVRVHFA